MATKIRSVGTHSDGFNSPFTELLEPRRLLAAIGSGAGGIVREFGSNGTVLSPLTAAVGSGRIAVQSDGRILQLAGDSRVIRYRANGSIDRSFGNSGRVSITFSEGVFAARDIAIDSGGRAVIVGKVNNRIAVARLRGDGTYDPTFDGDGRRMTVLSAGSEEFPESSKLRVLVNSDNRIVVGSLNVFRLTTRGSFDSTFGNGDGVVDLTADNAGTDQFDQFTDFARTSDGIAILGAASDQDNSFPSRVLGFVSSDGSQTRIDASIASVGDEYFNDLTAVGNTAIIVGGSSDVDPLFYGFSPNGTQFEFAVPPFFWSSVSRVTTDDAGRVVSVSQSFDGNLAQLVIMRHFVDGRMDTSFGDLGMIVLNVEYSPTVIAAAGDRVFVGFLGRVSESAVTTGIIAIRGGNTPFASPVTRTTESVRFSFDNRANVVSMPEIERSPKQMIFFEHIGYLAYRNGITPQTAPVIIETHGGDDRISVDVQYADLIIRAGDGNDRVTVGNFREAKSTIIQGGAGKDVLRRYGAPAKIEGGGGADRIYGGDENDTLLGNAGNDRIEGNAGNDNLFGGSGNDTLVGGAGRDLLHGQAGNDFIGAFDGEIDTIDGGAGVDRADRDPLLDLVSEVEIIN